MANKAVTIAKNICSKQLSKVKSKIKKQYYTSLAVDSNKIVFNNFGGRGFGCNPKYIAQELLRQNLGYDLVWLVKDMNTQLPQGIRKVLINTDDARKELATAKVVVTNIRFALKEKKKEQYMIQTWHSSYGIKCVEAEAGSLLPEDYIKMAKRSSSQTDLFVSGGSLATQRYKQHFWYDGEIMECGCPRNDVLFANDEKTVSDIRKKLGVQDDSKLVLYAPTFRGGTSLDAYSFDCKKLLETLESKGEKWKILIRLHPNAANLSGGDRLFEFGDKIIDTTPHPDFQELMQVSDILVTDYSSSVFDFALTGREILMYTPDLEQYKKERGVRPMFFEIPYQMCTDNTQLNQLAAEYTPQKAKEKADKLVAMLQSADNGTASAAVVQRIKAVTAK